MREHYQRIIIVFCTLIAIGILILDQLSKHFASHHLDQVTPVVIVDCCFQLILVHNPGAAFGIMSGMAEPLRTIILSVFSLVAFFLLLQIYRNRPKGSWLIPIGISFVVSGALGNLIDRFRNGYVVDFLDVFYNSYHWPTFNIADSAITVGVILLMIQILFERNTSRAS